MLFADETILECFVAVTPDVSARKQRTDLMAVQFDAFDTFENGQMVRVKWCGAGSA